MKLPSMLLPVLFSVIWMPVVNPPMASPLIVAAPAATLRPTKNPSVPGPRSSTLITALVPAANVLGDEPGCVYPSMTTGAMITGNGVTGAIVAGPFGILKVIVLRLLPALASMIACRNEPAPASSVLVTTNCPLALGVLQAENSDVPPAAVAVAVITSEPAGGATENSNVALPLASVAAEPDPR